MTTLAVVVGLAGVAGSAPSRARGPDVRADFNGDGAEDLAVGAPGESVGTVAAAGAVNVIYGSGSGLTGTGSQLFTQDTAGVGSTAEAGDRFGQALATGDFNSDGFDDLAVGAPSEDAGTIGDAGAVNVLFGSASGLTGTSSQLFTQDVEGVGSDAETFDLFGFALAAGDFNADGSDDLAIGAPTENVGTVPIAGAVNVLDGSGTGLLGTGSQLFTQDVEGVGSTVEADDTFGRALATGDVNGDGAEDLAIGAPGEDAGTINAAGAVNVLLGSASGLSGTGSQLFTQDVAGVGSDAEAGDVFGFELAAGDVNGDGPRDLAIGAPAEDAGTIADAGAVNVLFGSASGLTGTGSQLFTQDVAGVGSDAEAGDRFGDALAAGNFNGNGADDLAIGAPTEDAGTIADAGAVNVLLGSASGLTGTGSQLFTQDVAGVGSDAEAGDRFGDALAAGDVNGNGAEDLAIGAPAEDAGTIADAGAVNVLLGSASGLTGTGSQLFTQDVAGIGSDAEAGDSFGHALAIGSTD